MADSQPFSLKVRNFKCFGEEAQGFEEIKPITLIIGRNNSGKSSLLDLIEHVTKPEISIPEELWHARQRPEIIGESVLTEAFIKPVFREERSRSGIPGRNHWEFGEKLIGSKLTWRLDKRRGNNFLNLGSCPDGSKPVEGIPDKQHYEQQLSDMLVNPFAGKEFRRVHAERNIISEGDSANTLTITGNGQGATNVIQNFINKANLPSALVEETILNELNEIFSDDGHFTDIVCQQDVTNYWEIFLKEDTKGLIPLSQSGSGLKTILLVLSFIHLLPFADKKKLSDFIFAFEELENNLHPALLRRLLSYLTRKAEEEKFVLFLTTHSNVTIDLFSKNPNAQIVHVTHDGKTASCKTVKTYVENRGILDDLDVRASDLLQSNGVIWVEGPSDRIYLNRWISLWSNGELAEGTHYQCVSYGGRLLSHLSSKDPDEVAQGVSMLRVNKNALILIDSDKKISRTPLNSTKKRIVSEIKNASGIAWVTAGKEIENYIPENAVSNWLVQEGICATNKVTQVDQYSNFFDYLDSLSKGLGKNYSLKKPLLAERISPHINRNDLVNTLDLSSKLDEVCNAIRKWNNL